MAHLLMKSVFASALAIHAVSGFAATSLDTPAFSLEWPTWPSINPSLVSHQGNSYKFSIPEFNLYEPDNFTSNMSTVLHGAVKDGYRISAISISATVASSAYKEAVPAWLINCSDCDISSITEASASAWGSAYIGIEQDEQEIGLFYRMDKSWVYGTEEFKLTYDRPLTGEFDLNLTTTASAWQRDGAVIFTEPNGEGGWYTLQGDAFFRFSNYALEVEVARISPVPEPATYGMLLGGLAILGFAASQRKA